MIMEIRRQIFNSVYEFMQNRPINELTVDDILNASGVSRGSFYKYFADKYDVINSYFADTMNRMFLNCRLSNWNGILRKQFEFLADNASFFKYAFKTTGQNSFCVYFNCHLVRQFGEAIIKYGHQTELSAVEKHAVQFYADGVVAYTRRWLSSDMSTPIDEVVQELTSLIPQVVLDATCDEITIEPEYA
ncbi:TetR/AcrR family transcriptional regulator [Furfurilactobacillus rossiae]|uniref:HTH tetR-type domain-containing protein n=2 Tax=Furfurilactobacillus rossiae TaxID=231049 RepID=A0A0R1REI7_9LACO|nr:TetR/AcrR family transcriptional regulator [Furfurilactobacillus rossiae]KRL53668.1 hypothetical protein FD35_GL000917 [Furfurilactobacillus rossiae DSM 15814]QFR67664.1 TetR family transcriptional regulator [Furfurilactobacillus rossiae]QLE60625.1 Transcriptional regulator TetR [Furfurilactobacillus rossiae]